MTLPPHSIRGYIARNDRHFVIDSWVKSARALPQYKWAPEGIYYRAMTDAVGWWLDGDKLQFVVAVNPADDCQIFGYAAWAPVEKGKRHVAHWVYVKAPWRRSGLGAKLLKACAAASVSHWPDKAFPGLTAGYSPSSFWTDTVLAEVQRMRQKRREGERT